GVGDLFEFVAFGGGQAAGGEDAGGRAAAVEDDGGGGDGGEFVEAGRDPGELGADQVAGVLAEGAGEGEGLGGVAGGGDFEGVELAELGELFLDRGEGVAAGGLVDLGARGGEGVGEEGGHGALARLGVDDVDGGGRVGGRDVAGGLGG